MNKNIDIGGRLHSTATGNVVTGANEVFDDDKNKKQSEINTETYTLVNEVNAKLDGLSPEQQGALEVATKANKNEANLGYYVCGTEENVAAKVISDATGYILSKGGSMKVKMTNANTANNATLNINSTGAKPLYYDGERASANNTWEAGETVEIYYDGTNFYANNVAGNVGNGVFDVSEKYPTSGVDSGNTYTLEGALAVLNTNLPTSKKKGGMSIKFIQSSDNKYVQARCMAQNFTTDVTQWQGVDDEPTANSKNLVESNGIYNRIGVIDNSIEWIKPNWYGFTVGSVPTPNTGTTGHYQSTYFKVLKGDVVKVVGKPATNKTNYAVCGKDKKVISCAAASENEVTEVTINQDGYFYYYAIYDYPMYIAVIRDNEAIIQEIQGDIALIKEYIHIENVGTITKTTNNAYKAHSAVVSIVAGKCSIISWILGGNPMEHYQNVGTGLYFVKRDSDITTIRLTGIDESATVIIYYCNKTEYEWFLKQIADDSRSVTSLIAAVNNLTTVVNNAISTDPIAQAENITSTTNVSISSNKQKLVIVDVTGTGTCTIVSWGTVGDPMEHYLNAGAGQYIVKRPSGLISNIRITSLSESASLTVKVYKIPANLVDAISILYDNYVALNNGLDAKIAEKVDAALFDNQFVDYSDSYYDSLGKYLASYKLSNDYLSLAYFNRKLATKDALLNSAGKTCYYNGYLYVIRGQNHIASGNGEWEYTHLAKISTTDNTDWASIIAFDVDEVLTFQDSSTITIVKAHEGCLNVDANGVDLCTYIEYLDNGVTKYQMVYKHYNHSLVEQSVEKCSLVYQGSTYNFAHDDIPEELQGYQRNNIFNANIAFDGTYYYGAWGEKQANGTYILRTTDFITWNYVFAIPSKYKPYGEVGIIFNTDNSYMYCAVRCMISGTYIFRVRKSNWSIVEDMWIKGASSMGTFFRFNDKLYAFVNNSDRHYYRFINIDENKMTNGHIICDTNGIFFGPNTNISTDGTYLYGCETALNLRVLKFILPTVQRSECDSIIAGLLDT